MRTAIYEESDDQASDERAFIVKILFVAQEFIARNTHYMATPVVQSYPTVDSDGGSASAPLPHDIFMSVVSSSSIVDPAWNASQSRKQFDFHGFPSTVTACEKPGANQTS